MRGYVTVTRHELIEVPTHIVQFLDFLTRTNNEDHRYSYTVFSLYPSVRPSETIKLVYPIKFIFGIESVSLAHNYVKVWRQERGYAD